MNAKSSMAAAVLCVVAGLAAAQAQSGGACEKACGGGGQAEKVQLRRVELLPTRNVLALQPAQAEGGREMLQLRASVQPEQKSRVQTRTVMVHSENGREFKVEMNGDNVKAWVDGERLPEERVKVGKNKITLHGEDGETIHEFSRTVTAHPAQQIVIERDGESPIIWYSGDDEEVSVAAQEAQDHPPVMIGINMGSLDEGSAGDEVLKLLEKQDLGAEDVIVVASVIDGLPADKAGLEDGDVVVRIDGEWGVTPESLRDVLMEKEPGDSIEVLVVRDGKRKEFEIELAPYDTGRLGQGVPMGTPAPTPYAFEWRGENEEMHKLLEKLHSQRGELDAEIREMVERLQSENFERFRQLDEMPRFRVWGGEGQPPRALVAPAPPQPPSVRGDIYRGPGEDRLRGIEERLDRIESRLDRLLEALENREHDSH